MAAGESGSKAVARGIRYLVQTQNERGRWDEKYFTGTGFPQHFMIRYHLYRDYFPLMALGHYLQLRGRNPHV
jgi:squalene-hopene/tetraprenyl-beta-curcumene cyclase